MSQLYSDVKVGSLLLAEPFMQDEYFKRSVVLVCDHSNEGTIGLMLNKPTIFKVNQMIGNFPYINSYMFNGGPCEEDRLNYLHCYADIIPNAHNVGNNIYWNGDYNALKEGIVTKNILPHNIIFFSGYAGWGYDQLQDEFKTNSWIVCNNYKSIFRNSEYMWQELLQYMGGSYKLLANFPENPSWN